MAVFFATTIMHIEQNNHNVPHVKRWEITQKCADQVCNASLRDVEGRQYPCNPKKLEEQETSKSNTSLEQIPKQETVNAFYKRELIED